MKISTVFLKQEIPLHKRVDVAQVQAATNMGTSGVTPCSAIEVGDDKALSMHEVSGRA